MTNENSLLLEKTLEKLTPLNCSQKIDMLLSVMQTLGIPHTKEVELRVLYEIRRSKVQVYFKEQWQKCRPARQRISAEEMTSQKLHKETESFLSTHKKGKKKKKKEKHSHLLPESVPLPTNKAKQKSVHIDPFEMVARREERMAQNRDKRVQPGYSSTGVKLPTAQAIKERKEKLQHYREVYYTNKRYKVEGDPKRGNGYIYIDTPM